MSEQDIYKFNQIQDQIDKLNAEKDRLAVSIEPKIKFIDDSLKGAADLGITCREFALLIDPTLREFTEPRKRKAHRPRKTKVYTNPMSGEVIETKGGNHSILKSWKAEYGNDMVEGWLKIKSDE